MTTAFLIHLIMGLFPPPFVPTATELSPDWYPSGRGPENTWAWRTNHRASTARVVVRGTRSIGLRFNTTFHEVPVHDLGRISWRLTKVGAEQTAPWHHGVAIERRLVLAEDLDPKASWLLEFETTHSPTFAGLLEPLPRPRWRRTGGLEGRSVELTGIVADPGAIFETPPVRGEPLYCLFVGDSIFDGIVPLGDDDDVTRLDPRGAHAHWGREAVGRALDLLNIDRQPVVVNHSFAGWWGCRMDLARLGYEDEATLRRLHPELHPPLRDILNRSDRIAPEFAMPRVDLIIYQLGTNDTGSGRLADPAAYARDVLENVVRFRAVWPEAAILYCTTHLGGTAHSVQRRATAAVFARRSASNTGLRFVDLHEALLRRNLAPPAMHPSAEQHSVIAGVAAEEIAKLLEEK